MQATVQRPFSRIVEELGGGACVFVLGCGGCATAERFGGAAECAEMVARLRQAGIEVTGGAAPEEGQRTCDRAVAAAVADRYRAELAGADTVLLLACPLSLEAVRQVAGELRLVRGTQVITGNQTGGGRAEVASCHYCAECIAELASGLCPHAYCPKGLLNGPCGGAQGGRCEVLSTRQCVWEMIYWRLKQQGRLEVLRRYNAPADFGVAGDED